MIKKTGVRSRRVHSKDDSTVFARNASMLSVNGSLRSMYYEAGAEEERSQGYTPIQMGKPLIARYLYFFLKLDGAANNKQEIMVSTFVKAEEHKKAAAEAVNFYDQGLAFSDGSAEVTSFGADTYGHELIYYTRSFVGEPLRLTTRIMELDNAQRTVGEIKGGIARIANMPFFAEYLPYVAIAQTRLELLGSIFKILDRDDPLVPGLRLDLFHDRANAPRLQSGRIVCVQGKTEDELLASGYHLNKKNRLVDANGKVYTESSYYVIQLDSERQPAYDSYEYFQNAAELLALTNRSDGLKDFIETAAEGFKTYADIATIADMEDLQDDLDDPQTLARFRAMFKGLSGDVRGLYRAKYRQILDGI